MKLGAAMLVVVLSIQVLSQIPVRAADAPGCEGLAAFREELFPIWEFRATELAEIGLPQREITSLSSDDWVQYAETSLAVQKRLKEISPPAWLTDWLTVRIEMAGLQEQAGKAAAADGFLVILGFEDEVTKLNGRDNTARTAAIQRCSAFEQFIADWEVLGGEVDGTPVAA